MSDLGLQKEMLRQIEEALRRIERRFEDIDSVEDFTQGCRAGQVRWYCYDVDLDGRKSQKLEKYGGGYLLEAHPEIDWKGAKGVRDILSHHYGNLDAEVVFNICEKHIQGLKIAINKMQKELENNPSF